jgi:hypothetical protein
MQDDIVTVHACLALFRFSRTFSMVGLLLWPGLLISSITDIKLYYHGLHALVCSLLSQVQVWKQTYSVSEYK